MTRMQSKMMLSTLFRFPLFLVITLLLFLSAGPLKRTHAQKYPSYLEGINSISHVTSQAKSGGYISSEHIHVLQGLLQLTPSQVYAAVLQASNSLSNSVVKEQQTGRRILTVPAENGQLVSTELCFNHTSAFVMELMEKSEWALQMLDSMGKPAPGLLQGNVNWPGEYKQCLNVLANTTYSSTHYFSGQYCTAKVPLSASAVFASMYPVYFAIGICVPDTCSSADVTELVREVLSSFDFAVDVANQTAVDCAVQVKPLDAKAIVAIVICSLILAVIVVGTILDILFIQWPKWQTEKIKNTSLEEETPLIHRNSIAIRIPDTEVCMKTLLAFSVYTNGSKLLSTNQQPGSLSCIHGIRFLSMTWVVLGHTFLFSLMAGSANIGPYFQDVSSRWTFQAIANATVSVDTFFVLSGLLVAYLSLNELRKKNGKINWFLFFFHRFWRLTPVYMLVIMVYHCLSPYWGEGPLWPDAIADRDSCKTYWWTNLLYINNIVKTKQMCLVQSWYLANDMQFYILSPLIFLPFFMSPVFGIASASVFLIVTAIVPGVLTYVSHYPPGLLNHVGVNNTDVTNLADYMTEFYMKPYNRMGPYVVGMLAGYILYIKNCKIYINKYLNLSIWAAATGCAIGVVYGLYDDTNELTSSTVSAFYNAISRQVWGACVAWVVIACVTGNGGGFALAYQMPNVTVLAGFVNTILSWSAVVPLSRLTYCIYLLHIMLIELYLFNRNTVLYLSDINLVMLFLGILMVSYMAAAITSLAFEAPMMGLEKVFLHRDKTTSKE